MADAEEFARTTFDAAQRLGSASFAWPFAFMPMMMTVYARDDAVAANAILDGLDAQVGDRGWGEWNVAIGRAWGLLTTGRTAEALSFAEAAEQIPGSDAGPIPWRDCIVTALVAEGDRDRARALARLDLDAAEAFGAVGFLAAAKRVLAMTLPDDDAIDLLREA